MLLLCFKMLPFNQYQIRARKTGFGQVKKPVVIQKVTPGGTYCNLPTYRNSNISLNTRQQC